MRVRAATAADGEFIAELCNRFAECELPPWRTAAEVNGGTAWRMTQALATADDRSQVVVAEDAGGTRLGFAWFHVIDDFYDGGPVAKLSEIAVVRDGTGAGAALMEAAEGFARRHGCDSIVLNVLEGNARARRFYRKHGFEPEYTQMVKPLV